MPINLHLFGIRYHGPGLGAALAALQYPPRLIFLFETQEMQQQKYNALPDPAIIEGPGGHIRPLEVVQWQLMSWHRLLLTPDYVAEQLKLNTVAFWQLASGPVWAVSTKNHTILIEKNNAPLVDLVTVKPAKGGGEMRLYAGPLALYDTYRSKALPLLAAAIAQRTGLVIRQSESYDC